MCRVAFICDLDDDPEGNYWHICVEGHGVTRDEVEEVLAGNYETATRSGAAASLKRLAERPSASNSPSFSSACPTTRSLFTPSRPTKSRRPVPESMTLGAIHVFRCIRYIRDIRKTEGHKGPSTFSRDIRGHPHFPGTRGRMAP